MSLHLDEEQLDFVSTVIENTRDLLDNVHCYDTEEFRDLKIAALVLNGFSVEEARVEAEG